MPKPKLTEKQTTEIENIARDFVQGGGVECGHPNSKYVVGGNTIEDIDRAADEAFSRCRKLTLPINDDFDELNRQANSQLKKSLKKRN